MPTSAPRWRIAAGAAYTADAAGVALTLDRALAPGETAEARYERPVSEPGLWNTEGEQIADFSGVTVTNEEPAASAVTGVEVVSEADEDDTDGLGEAIRIRLTFSEAVDVTGAPRLKIDMNRRTGARSGSRTRAAAARTA